MKSNINPILAKSENVILISECVYMKIGLEALLEKKAKKLGKRIVFLNFDSQESITNLLRLCREITNFTLLCDTRSKYFPYLFNNFKNYTSSSNEEKSWIGRHISKLASITYLNNSNATERLSSIEKKVIELLMNAWKPEQISKLTGLHVKTISCYKRSAMNKLGTNTLQELFQQYYGISRIRNIAFLSNDMPL